MKYLLVSDIHGSRDSGRIITEKFQEEKCDKIIILGDILYHGPRNDLPFDYNPKELIKMLNALSSKIIAVKGNCEAYVDQMVLDFKIANQRTIKLFGHRTLLTHGHIINEEKYPSGYECILLGHTHIAKMNQQGNTWFINPGSITIPKNNQPRSYGIISETGVTVKSITGDIVFEYKY